MSVIHKAPKDKTKMSQMIQINIQTQCDLNIKQRKEELFMDHFIFTCGLIFKTFVVIYNIYVDVILVRK